MGASLESFEFSIEYASVRSWKRSKILKNIDVNTIPLEQGNVYDIPLPVLDEQQFGLAAESYRQRSAFGKSAEH